MIDLIPQLPRTLKRHHPSRSQHHKLLCRRIPPSPLVFFLDAEFPETADQDILSRCEFGFDDVDNGLNYLSGLKPVITIRFRNSIDNGIFAESHGLISIVFFLHQLDDDIFWPPEKGYPKVGDVGGRHEE